MLLRDHSWMTCAPLFAAFAACTTPNPNYRKPGSDASVDGPGGDGPGGGGGGCESGAALRCDGTNLIRCNADGTAEVSEPCALGCNSEALRCTDIAPSNGLARLLDVTNSQPDLDLGDSATINTDTGDVTVAGKKVDVHSESVVQDGAPTIRVLSVKTLAARDVFVNGGNALAIVANGEIKVSGVFAASAKNDVAGAGAYTDGGCKGGTLVTDYVNNVFGGAGGGGFGSPGGNGGKATNNKSSVNGASGGGTTGNASLIPLRGGCDGGSERFADGERGGRGGGAIQLVSRTQIIVNGVVAANGGYRTDGGGSGGGILLEAPVIEISGGVVANGSGGAGCFGAQSGQLDAKRADGGSGCEYLGAAAGGKGGARDNPAGGNGADIVFAGDPAAHRTISGHGGGGVGRIRVNTFPGGLRGGGLYSPEPSQGPLGTR